MSEKVPLDPDPALVPNPNSLIDEPWTVDKVLETIVVGRPEEGTSSPVAFFHLLERLKTMKREGWRRFGIMHGESIADHMYRMALMSMFPPPALKEQLDLPRCTKMCLIHDMAESLVGDITPVEGVPKLEKSRREAETMDYATQRLLGGVFGGVTGREIREIWQEYEDSSTLNSKYVHDIDKLELVTQMVEYEKRAGLKILGEFAYVAEKMELPEMRAMADEVLDDRKAFWGDRQQITGQDGVSGAEHKVMSDKYYDKAEKGDE